MIAKKALAIMMAAALLLCGCGGSAQPSETTTEGTSADTSAEQTEQAAAEPEKPDDSATFLSAAETAEKMGAGISLGNTMEAYSADGCGEVTFEWTPVVGNNTPTDYETLWGAPVTTQAIIDGLKSAGFDTVRIPVFWGNMMENDGNYTINADYIARVKEIVDYCFNDDLYVVINIHHFDEFIIRRNSLEDCKAIFNNLWTQIAEYFKDYSGKLVFEGFNEYLGGQQFDENGVLADVPKAEAYELTNALNQTFVSAVRATGGKNANRVLIFSGYWTNIDLTTSDKFIVPTDTVADRLMVSVHYVDNSMYWSNKLGGKEWTDYISAQCELLTGAFTSKNIPVFLGETTTTYPADRMASDAKKTSSECMAYVLNKLLKCGFVPILWDTTDNFYLRNEAKIKNDDDREALTKIIKANKAEKAVEAMNTYEIKTEETTLEFDGNKVYGISYSPVGVSGKVPAVILSHGYNCIGTDMQDIAEKIAEKGFVTFVFDFCGGSTRSQSSGETTEMSIDTEKRDLLKAVDYVSAMDIVDSEKLYLYGESQGGFVSLLTASDIPDRFAGMFLVYPALSIIDNWLSRDESTLDKPINFNGMTLSRAFYDSVPRYDIYEKAKDFKGHVMIYHGDEDGVVAVSYSEKLITYLPDATLTVIKGAGHGFGGKDRKSMINEIIAYLGTV